MRNLKFYLGFLVTVGLFVSSAFAASTFDPTQQPLGYISPAAINADDLANGSVAYLPKLDVASISGDLVAARFLPSGTIDLLRPEWTFGAELNAMDWDSGRKIVTMHKDGYAVPFRKNAMDVDAVDLLKPDEDDRINFLRGDRSKEGDKVRQRTSVLGHIVHSNPVYVGAPSKSYGFNNYDAFKSYYSNREGRVFVGSNSGMLHAIDAVTGQETFAYVPSPVIANAAAYSKDTYGLSYTVDGAITVEDAYFDSSWHTVLVGGLGAGGQGFFGLDVTSTAPITSESNAAGGAGERVMWEFNRNSAGSANLGYTYSRASIVKLSTGQWAAVVGNGYLSDSGKASLYVLNVKDGSVIAELVVSDTNANGLSSPTLVDVDGDLDVDIAYAGDLNGNVWKFDISNASTANWNVAYTNKPLFVARAPDGTRQPITSAVDVGVHATGGYMVYAATGRLLAASDAADITEQAVYGVRDYNFTAADLPLVNNDFVDQTMAINSHPSSSDSVRTASANSVDWALKDGWRLSLNATGSADGERVIQDIQLRAGRIAVSSMNPNGSGANWLLQINAATGGAPAEIVFDMNSDGEFTAADNVDGNADNVVTETDVDRIMALYKGTGLASRTTSSQIDNASATLITNRLMSIPPTFTVTIPVGEPGTEDYGLAGGHMDLDVSSRTYPMTGKNGTDKHVHEWDDTYGNIVDFFKIDEQGGFRSVDQNTDLPGNSPGAKFIVNIANAGLSPGAILEINGIDFPVRIWQAKVKRYLTGTMEAGEWFPIFKLGAATATETSLGIVQLTGLKMKFFADAIIAGGLHPTNTGCVKKNNPGPNGEYRNGALTTQLLDASGVASAGTYGAITPLHDTTRSSYEGITYAVHNSLYYAKPPIGTSYGTSDGLFWESTLFWHWSGPCYTTSDATDYATDWLDQVGSPDQRYHDDPPGTGSFMDPFVEATDPTPGGDPEVVTTDAGGSEHDAATDAVSIALDAGRLFWREWIPDNN